MLASTSKTMLRAVLPRATPIRYASSTSSSSTPLVSDTLPVSPPTTELPASPLPAQYRAPAGASSSSVPSAPSTSASIRPRFAAAPGRIGFNAGVRTPYKLHVMATRNNTILTLTTTPSTSSSSSSASNSYERDVSNEAHHVVDWVSAGSAGYKGASRGTYDAAVEVSLRMFKKIQELVRPSVGTGGQKKKEIWARPTELELVWKGFGQGRDAVFRSLMGGEGDAIRSLVNRVTDATPIKIGGTRAKKRRVI